MPGVIRHPIDPSPSSRTYNAAFVVGVMDCVSVPLDVGRERSRGRSPHAGSGSATSVSSIDLVGEASERAQAIVHTPYREMKEDDLAAQEGYRGVTLGADKIVCDAVYRAGSDTSSNKVAREQGTRELTGGREPNVEAMGYALA